MKILLGRPTPRGNISEVNQWKHFPCDVVEAKYMHNALAFWNIRKVFLANDYDYLLIAPDDLAVSPAHIIKILRHLDIVPMRILSGFCNVEEYDKFPNGNMNISMSLPPKERPRIDKYHWLKFHEIPRGLFKVAFAGFGLTAICREIVEQYEFPPDGIWRGKGKHKGCCHDVVFSHWCQENKETIVVDGTLFIEHFRSSGTEMILKLKPELIHTTADKTFNLIHQTKY